jgi:hypothetical protein
LQVSLRKRLGENVRLEFNSRIIKEINYLSGEAKPAIDTLKTELADLSKALTIKYLRRQKTAGPFSCAKLCQIRSTCHAGAYA